VYIIRTYKLEHASEGIEMAIVIRDGVEGKICSACKAWKPVEAYSRQQRSRDGYQANCKVCSSVRYRAWIEENPDKVRMQRQAYAEANREKIRDYRHIYDAEHRERRLAYIHTYDKVNRARKSERRREYYRNNPEAQERDRRAVRENQRASRKAARKGAEVD